MFQQIDRTSKQAMVATKPAPRRQTVAELAKAVGISERQLSTCFANGCPRGPVDAIKEWRTKNVAPAKNRRQQSTDASNGKSGESLADLQRAKLRVQVRRDRRKERHEKGLYVLRADAVRVVAELCTHVKNRLEALPDEIQLSIPREHRANVRRVIENKIRLALMEMAQWQI